MRRWDTLTLLCLILVALVTPYELAFLNPGPGDTVFIMNRVIDSVFIFDILLCVPGLAQLLARACHSCQVCLFLQHVFSRVPR